MLYSMIATLELRDFTQKRSTRVTIKGDPHSSDEEENMSFQDEVCAKRSFLLIVA